MMSNDMNEDEYDFNGEDDDYDPADFDDDNVISKMNSQVKSLTSSKM